MAQRRQINVRSPFYVEETTSEPIIRLNLRVWRGNDVTDKPTEATYVLEKESVDGKAIFEISELVRDYIEQRDLAVAHNTTWVETEIIDFTLSPSTSVIYLATEGYTTHMEPVQKTGDSFTPSFVMLPKDMYGNYRMTGAEGFLSYFQVMNGATNLSDWRVTTNNKDGSTTLFTLIPAYTEDSDNIISTLAMTEDIVSMDFDLDGDTSTVYHDIFDCNKYNTPIAEPVIGYDRPQYYNEDLSKPVILNYVNKFGAKNTFAFTLKHTEEIATTSESFKRNVVNYSSLGTSNTEHSSRKIVKASKQTFTINTDFINEYFVEQLEELILSEYVWERYLIYLAT